MLALAEAMLLLVSAQRFFGRRTEVLVPLVTTNVVTNAMNKLGAPSRSQGRRDRVQEGLIHRRRPQLNSNFEGHEGLRIREMTMRGASP